jgi:hypothetical protein
MVSNYKKKSNHGSWSEKEMESALLEARKSSIRTASQMYGIPVGTLHRHLVKNNPKKKLGRFKPVFTPEQEIELSEHAVALDHRLYGLTREAMCILAFEFAERNSIEHPFRGGKAGDEWIVNFMKRNPQLSFRTPEPTSIARASAFNRTQVNRFYDNLWKILSDNNLIGKPFDIYNMDETGIKTSSERPPKVISTKGKKQVGVIATAERGELTTLICCCSSVGYYLPPCFVYGKRKRVPPQFLDGGPPGCKGWCSESGWINKELFLKWLAHFIECVRPSPERKVLLIMDNHVSHNSLEAIELSRANGVILLSVPPHTTHKLQPLDVSVYKAFKTAFERTIDTFMKNHPGRRIVPADLAGIVNVAFGKSATMDNAVNGFRKCGIVPFDRDLFTDLDYAPSEVHYRPPLEQEPGVETHQDETVPATPPLNESTSTIPSPSVQPHVSPKEILPLPKCLQNQVTKRKRRCQKSEILTSSPYKKQLEEKNEKIKNKENRKNAKKNLSKGKSLSRGNSKKKSPEPPKEPEEETWCLTCGEQYLYPPAENWIQCGKCEDWSHELCADLVDPLIFICDHCRS